MSELSSEGRPPRIPVADRLREIEVTFPEPVRVACFDRTKDLGPL
jgi:hypothetical protein